MVSFERERVMVDREQNSQTPNSNHAKRFEEETCIPSCFCLPELEANEDELIWIPFHFPFTPFLVDITVMLWCVGVRMRIEYVC